MPSRDVSVLVKQHLLGHYHYGCCVCICAFGHSIFTNAQRACHSFLMTHAVDWLQWWNPTIEEQAIDRAHRIGQTRTVHVTRITIAGKAI